MGSTGLSREQNTSGFYKVRPTSRGKEATSQHKGIAPDYLWVSLLPSCMLHLTREPTYDIQLLTQPFSLSALPAEPVQVPAEMGCCLWQADLLGETTSFRDFCTLSVNRPGIWHGYWQISWHRRGRGRAEQPFELVRWIQSPGFRGPLQ